jgi:uncharacterized protein YndB with AHSA1/START domain
VGIFRFRSLWHLPAPADDVYAALAQVEQYPAWWPQVREARRVDERSGWATVRSVLPYTLHLLITREVEDPEGRVLRVRLDGDLVGWTQWAVVAETDGDTPRCVVEFTEEASVSGALAPFASVTAPALRLNHAWMMAAGEKGLTAYLSRQS